MQARGRDSYAVHIHVKDSTNTPKAERVADQLKKNKKEKKNGSS